MKMPKLVSLSLLIICSLFGRAQDQQAGISRSKDFLTTNPVFQVDVPYPTTDKPQSKLWYKDGCWWAILPRSGGPSLWQRTSKGWKENTEVNRMLQGVPGRADVWFDKENITAVGVTADSLVVFRIGMQKGSVKALATLKLPAGENIETATIAKDSKGEWWVAADGTNTIYAWHSADGNNWESPVLLKRGVNKDDISVITKLHGAVMVSWSNQNEEAVECRLHIDGHAPADWETPQIVEAGNKTADDHLHTTLADDGSVWMVTKNSVDSIGYAQLVLRLRSAKGKWINFPYMPRTSIKEASRPVIAGVQGSPMLLGGHTIYNKEDKYKNYIEFGEIDTANAEILKNRRIVIMPGASLRSRINDITVPKDPFPVEGPWIVLASDEEGRVYEVDLRR